MTKQYRMLNGEGCFVRSIGQDEADSFVRLGYGEIQGGSRGRCLRLTIPTEHTGGRLMQNGLCATTYTHRSAIDAERIDKFGRVHRVDPAAQNAARVYALKFLRNDLRPIFRAVLDSVSVGVPA